MTLLPESLTVGQLRRRITRELERAFAEQGRTGTPALDARLIVAHAAGHEANTLAIYDALSCSPEVEARAAGFVERRVAGEPVARILGEKEFWGMPFRLSVETLVPRPDTETIVSAALGSLDRAGRRNEPLKILDIGTGSGAILLALLSELPAAFGIGSDVVAGAAVTAQENARRLGLADRAQFVVGDWGAALTGGFDLVVTNPPYVVSQEIEGLPVEVWAFDPYLALDGGEDGLAAYRAVIGDLDRLLAESGQVYLEVGAGQANALQLLAENAGFEPVVYNDLAGIARVVELTRRGND